MIYPENEFVYGLFETGTDGPKLDIGYFTFINEQIMKAYEMKCNPIRKEINTEILSKHMGNFHLMINRIKDGWKIPKAVSAFHFRNINNYTLFTLNYIKLDNMMPMFPTQWQIEAAQGYEIKDYVSGLTSRKIGKSAFLSSHAPQQAIKSVKQIVLLAPTTQQMFVMEDIHRAVRTSDFLMDDWVYPKYLGKKHEGHFTQEHIEFGRNHSTISSLNLNINAGGETKRGIKGTDIYLDERQTVPKIIKTTVIGPALSDEFSRKKMMEFGTPNLKYDVDLADDFLSEQSDPLYYTLNYNWMKGLICGAISATRMKDVFKKDYKINCPFVRKWGVCLPELYNLGRQDMLDYYLGPDSNIKPIDDGFNLRWDRYEKIIKYPGDVGYKNDWSCCKQCLMNPTFAEEYGAKFGQSTNNFYTREMLEQCFRDYKFEQSAQRGYHYVFGVDFGKFVYHTQILVFKIVGDYLKLVYWYEVPLMTQKTENDGTPPSYWPIIHTLYDIYDKFNEFGGVDKLYLDVNSNMELARNIVVGDNLHPGIWMGKIYQNEPAEKRGVFGIFGTNNVINSDIKIHYQKQLISAKLIFPNQEEEFRKKFMWEHLNCNVEPSKAGHLTFEPPNRAGLGIDIMDAASYAALHLDTMKSYDTMMNMAVTLKDYDDENNTFMIF